MIAHITSACVVVRHLGTLLAYLVVASAGMLIVADVSLLISKALIRAASAPGGILLFGSKAEDGLFPTTNAGKTAARSAVEEGFVEVVRTEGKREYAAITMKGTARLNAESDPREVLEDFVRVLECRESEITQLLETSHTLAATLVAMKTTLTAIMPKVTSARVSATAHVAQPSRVPVFAGATMPEGDDLDDTLLTLLADYSSTAAAGQDCPLPELYRALSVREQPPSIGAFHDCLRRLHEDCRLYLHPWTGPLYAMPEPSYALLVGHNIAFYASPRR